MSEATSPILGVAFQPYVGPWVQGAPVLWNTYTLDQVVSLLRPVAKCVKSIATYGQGTFVWQGVARIQDSNRHNIHAAHLVGLKVSAGCALQGIDGDGFNVSWSQCDVDYALAQAKMYGNVTELIIGDECIFGPNSAAQLVTLMNYAKHKRNALGLSMPITTRQRWDVMAGVNNTTPAYATMRAALLGIVAACDGHIYVGMYPYFDPGIVAAIGSASADQAQFTTAVQASMSATWTALMNAWSAQQMSLGIRLGETGWPTSGTQPAQPVGWIASKTFAQWYAVAMKSWMTSNMVRGYLFEAYDEPWKSPQGGASSEAHFGVWTASGSSSAPNNYVLTSVSQKYPI